MWFTPTSWLQPNTDRWFGLTMTAKYDICDWVRSYDVQLLGNWLGGHRKQDILCGVVSKTSNYCLAVNTHDRQHAMWKLGTHTVAQLHLSSGWHSIHKGPERKTPQPYDSLHFCDVAICSWILISPPIDLTSTERFCLQLNAKMESKKIFFFLMSPLTFKRNCYPWIYLQYHQYVILLVSCFREAELCSVGI